MEDEITQVRWTKFEFTEHKKSSKIMFHWTEVKNVFVE